MADPNSTLTVDDLVRAGEAANVDVGATTLTIWQAQGVLMELLQVDATDATSWLMSTAARRAEPVAAIATEVVESRTI